MSMIDTEGSARTDYTGLLRHLLQRVDQLSLGAGQGVPPDEPPPPGSRAEAVLHRFRQELHAFQPRDLPRMMRLVGALDSWPRQQARMLGDVARRMAGAAGGRWVAAHAAYRAAVIAADVGDVDGYRDHLATLLSVSSDDTWTALATKLLRRARDEAHEDAVIPPHESKLLQDLPDETRSAVIGRLSRRTFPQGAYLCVESNPADSLVLIERGRAAVLHGHGLDERFLRFRWPGEVIGEMGWLAPERRRTASCMAATEMEVRILSYDALEQILAEPAHTPLREALCTRYHERRTESVLAAHPLLGSLDPADRAMIRASVADMHEWPRRVAPGAVLAVDGTPIRYAVVVLDGTLTSRIEDVGDIAVHRTGAIVGAESWLSDVRWGSELVCTEPGWVACIPSHTMRLLVDRYPMMARAVPEQLILP